MVESRRFGWAVGFLAVLLAGGLAAAGAAVQAKSAADPAAGKAYGSKNAPIVMEEFSDFQCPACRGLYQGVRRQLLDNYVNTGKVYLIHRDFPLPMHAHSRDAARYANAAARIGKFEKVEAALFAKQDTWAQNGDIDGVVAAVLTPAEMAKVRQLVKSGELDAAIDQDVARGQSFRVSQTPTLVFTHKGATYPVGGQVTYAILRQFLDQLLSQR